MCGRRGRRTRVLLLLLLAAWMDGLYIAYFRFILQICNGIQIRGHAHKTPQQTIWSSKQSEKVCDWIARTCSRFRVLYFSLCVSFFSISLMHDALSRCVSISVLCFVFRIFASPAQYFAFGAAPRLWASVCMCDGMYRRSALLLDGPSFSCQYNWFENRGAARQNVVYCYKPITFNFHFAQGIDWKSKLFQSSNIPIKEQNKTKQSKNERENDGRPPAQIIGKKTKIETEKYHSHT